MLKNDHNHKKKYNMRAIIKYDKFYIASDFQQILYIEIAYDR